MRLVEGYREYVADTDVGPTLIGAPAAWAGSASLPGGATAVQGEGIIVGMIDSGINFGSPSFAATDPVDGYVHSNPLGAGVYLGSCDVGGVDAGRCNDKLIGGYDFVCLAPGNQCGVAVGPRGAGLRRHQRPRQPHRLHGRRQPPRRRVQRRTAAHLGRRAARQPDRVRRLLHQHPPPARACARTFPRWPRSTRPSPTAWTSSTTPSAAVSQPWSEATSLAFLDATDAGIFVATSAGNSGPGAEHARPPRALDLGHGGLAARPRRLRHPDAGHRPGPRAAGLQPVVLNIGTGGVAFSATLPGTTPLRISAGIDTTSDGCNPSPYAAGSLTGAHRRSSAAAPAGSPTRSTTRPRPAPSR